MTIPKSTYIDHLPPIFQQSELLDGFLLAFEKVLSQASPNDARPALETVIARSHRYLRAEAPEDDLTLKAPDEFLPWLAGWVALTLREDWETQTQREFIRRVVGLYRYRGTKHGMTELLKIYLGATDESQDVVTIYDHPNDFGFAPPAHFFQVEIKVNTQDTDEILRIQQIAQAIIEQEKPAHTFYGLQINIPTMQLNSDEAVKQQDRPPLIVGNNTLLGSRQAERSGKESEQ